MYNMFCLNYKNYMSINKPSFRSDMAQDFDGLVNVDTYNKWKAENDPRYYNVCNLVYEIEKNINNYNAFETLAFELKMYGYEAISNATFDQDVLNEHIKLLALLLTTHYWIDTTK